MKNSKIVDLNKYAFIGIVENYNKDIKELENILNWDKEPEEIYVNKS